MDWTTPSQTQRRERDRERARETVDGTCGGCRVAAYTETTRTQHDPVSIPVVQKHTNVTIFLRKRSFFLRETSPTQRSHLPLFGSRTCYTCTLAARGRWFLAGRFHRAGHRCPSNRGGLGCSEDDVRVDRHPCSCSSRSKKITCSTFERSVELQVPTEWLGRC